ncbi:MAG: NADH-quinone oxidoreductase subunit J [Deltaproteobacteria bacterium]|nr:NADH-quinone oxidoreductase subunit J [Deltaproteobacteria bacterium]
MDHVTFFALALPLIFVAAMVILHPSPVYSALFLVLTLFLLAVYFLFLDAHMVAALQIIVYAGAIMVLFLFVIMLLNLQTDPHEHQRTGLRWAAGIGGGVLVFELFLLLRRAPAGTGQSPLPEGYGTVVALSERLFTDFLLPFEITSVLLLVAVVGAVVLAKRQV